MRVSYAAAIYGSAEIKAVVKVLENPTRIVAGPLVKEFETKIARLFGKRYGVMVNSGSSANLLALELLKLPKGSEVITPVLTFSTTLAPIIQKGLVPVFVDVKLGACVIDVDRVESLITKQTRALVVPNLIGNLPNWLQLKKIARRHKLWLIEDSCDTLGAKFAGRPTGCYSHISTTSFYASHIITAAGSGGMICVNDRVLARRALIMSRWGRVSTSFGSYEDSENLKKRFVRRLGGAVYDSKFIFTEVGYNFQPIELQGAFGLEQLKRLSVFVKKRRRNFSVLLDFFQPYERFFILPSEDPRAEPNWLAFPLTVRQEAPFTREEITRHLEINNIQTRPIFSGNVLKQPAFERIVKGSRQSYPVTDHIMRGGFLIGCHHGLTKRHLSYMKKVIKRFLTRFE